MYSSPTERRPDQYSYPHLHIFPRDLSSSRRSLSLFYRGAAAAAAAGNSLIPHFILFKK